MKIFVIASVAALSFSAPVSGQSLVAALCGEDHVNEAAGSADVRENPDGFYIVSLRQQVRNGDARIVRAVGDTYYFCTRSAATPEMSAVHVGQAREERVLKYLFVPSLPEAKQPAS